MPWPVFRSLASFRASDLPGDLIAGLTLAAIAIPEQMATARLGGFSPQIGFFAFIAGSLGFAVLGSNRFLSCGADSTITPIFAGGLVLMAASGSPDYQALAVALALMVGAILVVGGLFRLGWIANLLSTPVTVGFLAGISVHILVSQMPGVLGLASPSGPMLDRIAELRGISAKPTSIRSVSASACLPWSRIGSGQRQNSRRADRPCRRNRRGDLGRPREQGRQRGRHRPGNAADAVVAGHLPERWARLLPLSFLIAIVVMVQTAATTRSFPSDPDKPADVDRDFLGAGAGSILAGLFGAFPVNASPPRTGIVSETGGRSQLSGLFAAAIVLALLAFGATLLAARSECGARRRSVVRGAPDHSPRANRHRLSPVDRRIPADRCDGGCDHRAADRARCRGRHRAFAAARHLEHDAGAARCQFERVPGTTDLVAGQSAHAGRAQSDVAVVGLQAPLSFLNAAEFPRRRAGRREAFDARPRLLVIEASGILEIDFTAAQILLDLFGECRADGVMVAMAPA